MNNNMPRKEFSAEIQFRQGSKAGVYYTFINKYQMGEIERFYNQAKTLYAQASGDNPKAGPIFLNILNAEDKDHYTTVRKNRFAPDAVVKLKLDGDTRTQPASTEDVPF